MHYTPAQVQEMLDIPGSTLRYYAKRFEDQLTPRGGRKHRLYTDQDVTILSHIRDLAAANIPLDVIAGRLRSDLPPLDQADHVRNSLALVPTIAAEIANAQETARAAAARVDQLRQQVDRQAVELDQLRAAAARADQLAADHDQLRQQVDRQATELEELRAAAARPWWKKVISKK
jgi:DNA-binding transcriptional MerR regulator